MFWNTKNREYGNETWRVPNQSLCLFRPYGVDEKIYLAPEKTSFRRRSNVVMLLLHDREALMIGDGLQGPLRFCSPQIGDRIARDVKI
jgi:hypothetical protein